jgi:hypothetical protein
MGMERVQQFEGSYTVNCTLCTQYTVTYTHTELMKDIDNSRDKKQCCYIIVLSDVQAVFKKIFSGKKQAHYAFNIAHFKLLL